MLIFVTAVLDVLVHGGRHPWQLLQPVFGYPLLTCAINFFYHLWFFAMWGVMIWQAFSLGNPRVRMQYLLTFLLSWLFLGTIAAIAFSSAGPCYYGRVVQDADVYGPLMKYLWSVKESYPLWALEIQEKLAKAQIKLTEAEVERIKAQTQALNRSDGVIKIEADGLEPEIEAFMFRILDKVKLRMTEDYTEFLLGVSCPQEA